MTMALGYRPSGECPGSPAVGEHTILVREVPVLAAARDARPHSNDERRRRRIVNRVQAKLGASSYPAVRRVRCRCDGGVLTLRGRMPSYYCVQVAISLVRANVRGKVSIRNCLQVVDDKVE